MSFASNLVPRLSLLSSNVRWEKEPGSSSPHLLILVVHKSSVNFVSLDGGVLKYESALNRLTYVEIIECVYSI